MRTLIFLAATFTMVAGTLFSGSPVSAQQTVSAGSTYVCPKCGKLHTRGSNSRPTFTSARPTGNEQASYAAPVSSSTSLRANGGISNVLDTLNAQRARQGVGTLQYDPALQAVAERRAQTMASMRLKNHPPGSFAPGRYEGVGWSSSYSPNGVSACFTSDSRMRYAGAAMATGGDGVYFAVVYR